MPGLVPGIHVLLPYRVKDVDGRDKPGHDEEALVLPMPRQRQPVGRKRDVFCRLSSHRPGYGFA
jgi:hypothetical protein